MNAAREELSMKESESRELEHDYDVYVAACKSRIVYILCQDICSCISVRGSIMAFSMTSPPEKGCPDGW